MKLVVLGVMLCMVGCMSPKNFKSAVVQAINLKTFSNHLTNQKWQLYSVKEYHGTHDPDSAFRPLSIYNNCGSIYSFHIDSTVDVEYKGTCMFKDLKGYKWHIGREQDFVYLVLRKPPTYRFGYRLYKSNGDTMILYSPGVKCHSGIKVLSMYEFHHVKQ